MVDVIVAGDKLVLNVEGVDKEVPEAVPAGLLDGQWTKDARSFGSLPQDCFRVVVWESDHTTSHMDFSSFNKAREYANDAASESDDPTPLSCVFNHKFEIVHRGQPLHLRPTLKRFD